MLQSLRCSMVSGVHGIGKRKLLNIVKRNEEYCKAPALLGESLQIEDHLFNMIESMLCQAYGFLNKPNVNKALYEKCYGEKFPELSRIPP